jgi:hypothetical protein
MFVLPGARVIARIIYGTPPGGPIDRSLPRARAACLLPATAINLIIPSPINRLTFQRPDPPRLERGMDGGPGRVTTALPGTIMTN